MAQFASWLTMLGVAAGTMLASRSLVHYFQLESYQFPGYYKTVKRNLKRAVTPGVMMAVVAVIALLIGNAAQDNFFGLLLGLLGTAVALGGGFLIGRVTAVKNAKKKLVFTTRIKRLYVIGAIVFAVLCFLLGSVWTYLAVLVALVLPASLALAGLIAWPVEKLISEMYFRDAQSRLKERPDLIKIGITGSYGKTSVKFILGTMLSEKYQTLVTPSSFNTPMGVTRIIREKLLPTHQVFVAEMGARHVGDIKELCRLVHPTYGVLTSVGPQHLDTFKSIDRIKKTKYELMDAIPHDGWCFFPDDGAICRELYDKTRKGKSLCCLNENGEATVWAKNIRVSALGSTFTLCTENVGIECQTKLLGEHNIQNILLAASVCLKLGLSLRQIKQGIAKIAPVEHRLQLLPQRGGMTVIDDAFNSNPRGAEAALKVLSAFENRRIIITPGMVELGEGEAEFNRAFGEKMASAVDVAILVGKKHTRPIAEGLLSQGFPEENLHVTASLAEAAALLRQLGQSGDVVLFENDLPDHYSE